MGEIVHRFHRHSVIEVGIQLRMSPHARRQNDFDGSLYREPCPRCGASPFCWCRSVTTGTIATNPHRERRGRDVPSTNGRIPRLARLSE